MCWWSSPEMDDAPLATRDAWLAMVASTLKDGDVGRLKRRTPDGLTIQALYTAADAPPAAVLALPARDADRPWDVRTATAHPDPAHANREILDDLEGGAASILVRIDPSGRQGVAIGSAERLARALDGVILELAPVGLDAGFLGPAAADWLAEVGKSSPAARLLFNLDPLSSFAGAARAPDRSRRTWSRRRARRRGMNRPTRRPDFSWPPGAWRTRPAAEPRSSSASRRRARSPTPRR